MRRGEGIGAGVVAPTPQTGNSGFPARSGLGVHAIGWTEIDAFLHDGGALKAQLAEIDENLQRAELSPAQRATAITRRKELWEALHPEVSEHFVPKLSKRGITEGRPVEFAGDTAAKTGQSKQDINRHLSRAAALGPDIHSVVGTSLDKGVELDALKSMPVEPSMMLVDGQHQHVADVTVGEKLEVMQLAPLQDDGGKAKSTHGGARPHEKCFAAETSAVTGKNKSTITRAIRRANAVCQAARLHRRRLPRV